MSEVKKVCNDDSLKAKGGVWAPVGVQPYQGEVAGDCRSRRQRLERGSRRDYASIRLYRQCRNPTLEPQAQTLLSAESLEPAGTARRAQRAIDLGSGRS